MDFYHVLNRGVDKRKIFLDDRDRFRFVYNLRELNNKHWRADINSYVFEKSFAKSSSSKPFEIYSPTRSAVAKIEREPLVEVLAFCLMPNHYHLLLSPIIEGGIPIFMKKINMAFAKYFNLKYERVGALFQGRYKSVHITSDAHFIHLPYYIHCNPLDMFAPEWRERKINNAKRAIQFLESYRWSSHLDYLGQSNFPTITNRNFLLEVFGGQRGYKNSIESWLKELDLSSFSELLLE